jgi:hypothetical protein
VIYNVREDYCSNEGFRLELLIELRDDDRPLTKSDVDTLIEEIRGPLQEGVSVSARERRPGFGELGSLAHIWQIAVDLAASHGALAAGGTFGLTTALRPIFKILEKRAEQTITFKGPGFEIKGPASMFSDRADDLIESVKKAIQAEAQRPRRSSTGKLAKNADTGFQQAKRSPVKAGRKGSDVKPKSREHVRPKKSS